MLRTARVLATIGLLALVPSAVAGPVPVELGEGERPAVVGLASIRCFDGEFGWIYCEDPVQAGEIAADLREAAMLFHRYFGRLPERGAVVAATDVSGRAMSALREAGAAWVMPWIPNRVLENIDFEGEVRRQVETQLRERGLDDAIIEMAVKQALAQVHGRGAAARRGLAGVLARTRPLTHELGHFWFGRLVWGESWMRGGGAAAEGMAGAGTHRYGSPSPDWLDEVGAILLENEALTKQRFEQMTGMLAAGRERIIPLAKLFTMTHPGMDMPAVREAMREAGEARRGPPRGAGVADLGEDREGGARATVRVMPMVRMGGGDEQAMLGAEEAAGGFYAQCRSVAEFMIERSGRPRLFAVLAMDLKDDPSMEKWLSERGAEFGLPTTVEALHEAWVKWAMARHLGDL
jgi:hypothetical protein